MISGVFHNPTNTVFTRPAVNIAPAAEPTAAGEPDDDARAGPAPEASARAQATSAADGTSNADNAQAQDNDTNEQGLTEDEQREVQQLRERDREVRAHEQAHLAAAGQYARGGIQYTYERGPDSRMYAVGGQVSVDTSKVPGDPEATLQKAETLRRAALAPANPSSQDRSVASEMTRMAAQARQEIATEARETRSADDTLGANKPLVCPSCGARHSAEAHDGMTAYAGSGAPTQSNLAVT